MILVTGATGLVGSHLITALVNRGKKVKALYRAAIPAFEGADKAEWVKGDILDILSLEAAMQNIEQVYHCAAVVSFSPKKTELLNKTNIEGTANVVNACLAAGVKKLLFVSSVAALGRMRKNTLINETMNWSKETSNSEYGKTKYLAEMEVWRGIGEGLQAVIVNPTIILGEGDWAKGSTEIFKTIYNEFPWYTDGVSGFVDVKDVIQAMVMLMESDVSAERFILNSENLAFREVFDEIAENFGKKPPHKKASPFLASLVWRWESIKAKLSGSDPLLTKETANTAQAKIYFDNSKLLKQFPGFKYTPLKETIARICAWLKKKHRL